MEDALGSEAERAMVREQVGRRQARGDDRRAHGDTPPPCLLSPGDDRIASVAICRWQDEHVASPERLEERASLSGGRDAELLPNGHGAFQDHHSRGCACK